MIEILAVAAIVALVYAVRLLVKRSIRREHLRRRLESL